MCNSFFAYARLSKHEPRRCFFYRVGKHARPACTHTSYIPHTDANTHACTHTHPLKLIHPYWRASGRARVASMRVRECANTMRAYETTNDDRARASAVVIFCV